MSVFHKQRICVKFCVKIGKSVTETFEMLKIAFREEATRRTQTYKWWKHFKEGRNSVDDDPRSGQPSTSKTDDNVAMLAVFFDSDGVVHYEFLPQGQTVNKEYYLEVMQRLREAVRKKRPDAWRKN